MTVLKNRAGVSCATAGTGTITLGTAIGAATLVNNASWQSFASAGIVDGNTVRYLILDANGAWEYGTGIYTSAGTTLTRVLGASSTGSLLVLSGSSQVFIAAVVEDIISNNNGVWNISDLGSLTGTVTLNSDFNFTIDNLSTGAGARTLVNFLVGDNTQAGFSFISDHNASSNYIYSNQGSLLFGTQSNNSMFLVTNNTIRGVVRNDGFTGFGAAYGAVYNPSTQFEVSYDSAATNTVSQVFGIISSSSGTPAIGIGAGMQFGIETVAGTFKFGATVEAVAYTVTAAAEAIALQGKQMAAGALQEPFGISLIEKVITSNVAYTSNNSVQPWFPSGGAVTLEGSTTYEFEGLLAIQTTGASTTHTTGLSFTGGATLTSIAYNCESHFQLANTTMSTSSTTLSNRTYVNQAANTTISGLSGTTSAQQQLTWVRGIIRVNGAGTVIPNFTFSAGPGAGNVLANTFFKLRKLGSNTVINQGVWA